MLQARKQNPDRAVPPAAGGPEQPTSIGIDALLRENFRFVWRTLRRLGVSPEAADDAAQHVFIIASQKLELIAAGKERAFLGGTAVRVAANVRRLSARRQDGAGDEALVERVHPGPDPEQALDWKRKRELLDEALDSLPIETRSVFVLFELEGLSKSEVAELLGIPVGTVASRLRRAREQFQERVAVLRERFQARGGSW